MQLNMIAQIKSLLSTYYYHHEIIKNGIKIVQYLLAQQNDKSLILKPDDFALF